ncbi:unnamed protein product [Toxocara canis]|uniref:Uncharacterized protein n=1 Tax=Toxocara canis TaxID=6265 RepID=A0A3P7GUN4_TOXCA|nr:unnamed protein product [Toxocara canis]
MIEDQRFILLMKARFLLQRYTNCVVKVIKKCNAGRQRVIILLLLLALVLVEEAYIARVRNAYRNFYRRTIPAVIYKHRTHEEISSKGGVAILTVLKDLHNYEEYRLAQQSFECYAILHKYRWIVVDLSANKTLQRLCPHKDFMFARHCVTAQTMDQLHEQWVLFIDADMGVVNPNHLIEEWIDLDVHIIFYDRIFNFEIMAGSYLVRNSGYGRMFLHYLADYEYRLPSSVHGTDNGAVQNVFMEVIAPEKVNERRRCEKVWNVSRSFKDLFVYEACAREVLGRVNKWVGKARILSKGTAWARDTWLTNSMWSEKDFVLHGWQKRKMDAVMFASWPSPFTSHTFNMSICATEEAGLNWKYKDTFIRSEREIQTIIDTVIAETAVYYQSALNTVDKYL